MQKDIPSSNKEPTTGVSSIRDTRAFQPSLITLPQGQNYTHAPGVNETAITANSFMRYNITSHLLEQRTIPPARFGFDSGEGEWEFKQIGFIPENVWFEIQIKAPLALPVTANGGDPLDPANPEGGYITNTAFLSPIYEWFKIIQFDYINQPGIQGFAECERFIKWCELSVDSFNKCCFLDKELLLETTDAIADTDQNGLTFVMPLREVSYIFNALKATLASYQTNTFKLTVTMNDFDQYIYCGSVNRFLLTPSVANLNQYQDLYRPVGYFPIIEKANIRLSGKKKSELEIIQAQQDLMKYGLSTVIQEPYRVFKDISIANIINGNTIQIRQTFPSFYGRCPGMIIAFQVICQRKSGSRFTCTKWGNNVPWRYFLNFGLMSVADATINVGRTQNPFLLTGREIPAYLLYSSFYGYHNWPSKNFAHQAPQYNFNGNPNLLGKAPNSNLSVPLMFFTFSAEPFVNIQMKGDEGYINANGDLFFEMNDCNYFLKQLLNVNKNMPNLDPTYLSPIVRISFILFQEKMITLSAKGLTKILLSWGPSQ